MPNGKKIRLVADTNTWISTLISVPFRSRTERLFNGNIELLFSDELFQEINDAANKKSLRKYIDRLEYTSLLQRLYEIATLIEVRSVVDICRDPKDNFLLALAKDGNADYLMTGDNDLLVLKKFGKTKIVKMAEFEKIV